MRPFINLPLKLPPLFFHESFGSGVSPSPVSPRVQVRFEVGLYDARIRYTAFLPQHPGHPNVVHPNHRFVPRSPPHFFDNGHFRRVKSPEAAPRPPLPGVLGLGDVVLGVGVSVDARTYLKVDNNVKVLYYIR